MASSSSSSSAPKRSYATKGPIRNQQRYVPKTPTATAATSSSNNSAPGASTKPTPSLTTSLRGESSPPSSSSSKERRPLSGSFVNYLPQDEAVASGLGADAGGLDAIESQRVVDMLNEQLSKLLKMSPRDFWREVAKNESLHEFLDSYLQYRHRWYDFPHRGAKGIVAGVIVGEAELCRRVFMILYRMSSNRDPGANASDCLSLREHTALLQERKLLDLPKLLDICAIYGHDNGELAKSLVTNAVKAQPKLQDNISAVTSHFLGIVKTMHQRCSSSLEVLLASGGNGGHVYEQLYKDFLEVMDFINDAVVTLDAFVDAFRPAAFYFSISVDMSYGTEELLSTLAKLHDALLPSLQQGLTIVSKSRSDASKSEPGGDLHNVFLSLKMLSTRVVSLGWKLVDCCYICNEPIDESLLQTTTKMFPAKVEDPSIRGDIIIQTLKEINGEALYHFRENTGSGTFLQNIEKNHKILSQIGNLRSSGWVFMDEDQFQYLAQIATPPSLKRWEQVPRAPISSQIDKVQMDEDAIILESKISQIKDLFPEYGKGFLSACLDVYNHNPEEVIQRILEGTLHEDLLSLDTLLEQITPPKSSSHNRNDKGKAVLAMEPASKSTTALPGKNDLVVSGKDTKGPQSLSSKFGRFQRKTNEDSSNSEVLDSKSAKDAVRTAVLAAELEYEDEYDDSFDDLGLSVVESGYEETENLSDSITRPGKSWGSENEISYQSSKPRWSSQKKPQFYVKDGKNYSYKVSGSVGVSSAQEAAVVNQAQKETIHGLGRGGNIPLGAVNKMMDNQEEPDDESSNAAENIGRGNSNHRGRGGGRRGGGGGRNNYRKDRAMKKHFSGLGGY
ncbi:uncharacterized protein A4U43_C08F13280 [Asparagus officinalis]|uniref:activating signal cointegrator 1 complex subunit 2 n=1 Tax=Asparagus officinalis TaxID=4686 RepID=UPI00098E828B|nr:activating signal cointegrator 1 complex subunit 2 [Asparagus officinalis]ONK60012.1 uncharacterized protein A4U43_C08F13280 [Asparagus officinalis]